MKSIDEFLNKFHIETNRRDLYEMAFTHSSFNSDAKTHHHDYERLEFMGDSVLGFVIASLLFKEHPDMLEGALTKAKSYLVQSEYLAKLARKEGYPDFIRAGKSLTPKEVMNNQSILEDVFEAVIGAVYLDKGIDFARKFIEMIYQDDVKNFTLDEVKDYKSILQEAMQAEYRESVTYKIVFEKGPPHNRVFFAEVSFNGIVLGRGEGRSKKVAEQEAAKDALNKKAI